MKPSLFKYSRPVYYTLDDQHNIAPTESVLDWADFFKKTEKRQVARETFEIRNTEVLVSTVFLGIDHSFMMDGPPILFETMVFADGTFDEEYQTRCATWDEALVQHKIAVEWAKKRFSLWGRIKAWAMEKWANIIVRFRLRG